MRFVFIVLALLLCGGPPAPAGAASGKAVLASGAGYKKMVKALGDAYVEKTGNSLNFVFGNMGRVTALSKQSGKVDLALGDERFLDKAGLPAAAKVELGRGKLVLAFAKGGRFSKLEDLDNPEAGRIALPDTKKAIYGRAAREYLTGRGNLEKMQPRLMQVATIPQVFSYLATNEVDMGFLNLTYALDVKGKLGGYVVIDEKAYSPIKIVVLLLKDAEHKAEAEAFLDFLKTPEAREIIRRFGL